MHKKKDKLIEIEKKKNYFAKQNLYIMRYLRFNYERITSYVLIQLIKSRL